MRYRTNVLFLIYGALLCWIILFKLGVRFSYIEKRSINLVPFNAYLLSEVILNALIFVPLGVYTNVLFRKWTWTHHLLCFLLTGFIFEIIQFVFKLGAFDITDIISNTTGGLVGLGAVEGVRKIIRQDEKTHQFINMLMAIGTGVLIVLFILLKSNLLPIRYQ